MREIIQALLETEAEAKRLVQAAAAQAEGVVSAAQREAASLLATARLEGRRDAEKLIAVTVQAAETEKLRRITEGEADIKARVQLEPERLEAIVNAVVAAVTAGRETSDNAIANRQPNVRAKEARRS